MVELQQGSSFEFADPVLRYRGPDKASVVTGLPQGSHYFRIRLIDATFGAGPWSDPLEVNVVYMKRKSVIWLLVAGGCIVVATVIAIVAGHYGRIEER